MATKNIQGSLNITNTLTVNGQAINGNEITNYEVIAEHDAVPTATDTSADFVEVNKKLYRKKISIGSAVTPAIISYNYEQVNDNIGYIKLEGASSYILSADDLAEIIKDFCIISYNGELYYHSSNYDSQDAYTFLSLKTSVLSTNNWYNTLHTKLLAVYKATGQVQTGQEDSKTGSKVCRLFSGAFITWDDTTNKRRGLSLPNINLNDANYSLIKIGFYFADGQWPGVAVNVVVSGQMLASLNVIDCPVMLLGDDEQYIKGYAAKVYWYDNKLWLVLGDGTTTYQKFSIVSAESIGITSTIEATV